MARASSSHIRPRLGASGLSTLIKNHLAGGASRLAALLLSQILPVFSVVAPCQSGAALRDLVLVPRGQTTSAAAAARPLDLSPSRQLSRSGTPPDRRAGCDGRGSAHARRLSVGRD